MKKGHWKFFSEITGIPLSEVVKKLCSTSKNSDQIGLGLTTRSGQKIRFEPNEGKVHEPD